MTWHKRGDQLTKYGPFRATLIWTRCFTDRNGRVQRGTVYGDSVEQDSVFEK